MNDHPWSRRFRKAIRFVAWLVILFLAFNVATFDVPTLAGWTIIDARDPNRPGGMREVFPTPLGLVIEGCILAAAIFALFKTREHPKRRPDVPQSMNPDQE